MNRSGHEIHSYPKPYLRIGHSKKIPHVAGFDIETNEQERRPTEMKRTYTRKLFAGGEEATEFFASLARELAAIVKQS